MKAEHRKDLHTNLLADRMGRLVKGVTSNPSSTSAIVWVIVGVAVVTFGAWFIASRATGGQSDLWVKLDRNYNREELEAIAREHPGSMAARVARLQNARLLLRVGLASLCPGQRGMMMEESEPIPRAEALADVAEARKLFDELAAESNDDPAIRQECLLQAARAEEALVNPAATADAPFKGTLQRAIERYEQFLAGAEKDTPLYSAVTRHVQELRNGETAAENFYKEFNEIAATEANNRMLNAAPGSSTPPP